MAGLPLIDLPARLAGRLAADVETLARAARAVPDLTAGVTSRLDRMIELGERIDTRAEAILMLGERMAELGERMVALGERIDARADAILTLGSKIDDRGHELLVSAAEVATEGARVAEAIPTLHLALDQIERMSAHASTLAQTAEPLQGAAERLGRIVDRLPGARRRDEEP